MDTNRKMIRMLFVGFLFALMIFSIANVEAKPWKEFKKGDVVSISLTSPEYGNYFDTAEVAGAIKTHYGAIYYEIKLDDGSTIYLTADDLVLVKAHNEH